MLRTIILILLSTIYVQGQDAILVKELCDKAVKFSESSDIESNFSEADSMVDSYLQRNPLSQDNLLQDGYRFQYRLNRELKRSCPIYPSDAVKLFPRPVIDLDNKLSIQQIDSLSQLVLQINKEKKVYLYIVTIDDFYPDTTISEFSNRYRDSWSPKTPSEKGAVLIALSMTQRKFRISTGDISMTYLTDAECTEVVNVMMPHFRATNYFDGLIAGLIAIKNNL